MNTPMNTPDPLSERARALFERASERLDPDTLQRLRSVRRGVLARTAPARGPLHWLPATAFAGLTLAIGLGVWHPQRGAAGPADLPSLTDADAALLDEDPEVYAWLADAPVAPPKDNAL